MVKWTHHTLTQLFCATVGQMSEEMIKEYLAHYFEPKQNDAFEVEPD